MYSILHELDQVKAARDEAYAQQGWMNGTHTLSHTQSKTGIEWTRQTGGMSSYPH